MAATEHIIRVAIRAPLQQLFDYLPPANASHTIKPGTRVRVPFGRGQSVGIVVQQAQHTTLERSRLRRISRVLDTEPIIDDSLMKILGWAAAYYQQAPGEVYATALPALLRSGRQTDAM
ncbi:MAG: primosomal protein N', partial [Gammaproteobacteria bacterium]|nr:primosomal protein N' [Gammaproteobacteria bacterium]